MIEDVKRSMSAKSQRKGEWLHKAVIPAAAVILLIAAVFAFALTMHWGAIEEGSFGGKPIAIIENGKDYLLIDGEGRVLQVLADAGLQVIPRVTGLEFTRYDLGEPLKLKEAEGMAAVRMIVDEAVAHDSKNSLKILDMMDDIDVSDISNVELGIDGRLRVKLGNLSDSQHPLRDKMKVFGNIYANGIGKEDRGQVDMTYNGGYPPSFKADK